MYNFSVHPVGQFGEVAGDLRFFFIPSNILHMELCNK